MAKNKGTIAITGATGFLGSQLVAQFAQSGYNVIALSRRPFNLDSTMPAARIQHRTYEMNAPIDDNLLQGVDYLIHAAYMKLSKANPDAYEVNIHAARELLVASKRACVRRTIFISTMSAHDEAISIYGKQKLAIERLYTDHNQVVLKCGLIIGDGGIVRQMASFMKKWRAVPVIGGGKQPLQIVALQDLVQTIQVALQTPLTGSFIIASPEIYTYKQFYVALAKRLNKKVLFVPLPYWLLQTVFRMATILKLPLDIGEDNLKGLKMLRAMDSTKDLAQLGVTLKSLDRALLEIDEA